MIVFHVPHASTFIDPAYRDQFVLSDKELVYESHIMADLFVDSLVSCFSYPRVLFSHSRLVCDVERFRRDEDNDLFSKGMAVVYTRTHDGRVLRRPNVDTEKIKKLFYDPHHQRLHTVVAEQLLQHNCCMIVDVHSYADVALPYELHKSQHRPDICLGFEAFHCDAVLVQRIAELCKRCGYSVAYNEPFSGSIVPMAFYRTDKRVQSIMIEINKRVYLNGFERDDEKFFLLQNFMRDVVAVIETF